MKYDRSEAIRYLGGRDGDENAGVLADLAYLKLRNEVQARSVYRVLDCSVDADGVLCWAANILKATNWRRISKAANGQCFWRLL